MPSIPLRRLARAAHHRGPFRRPKAKGPGNPKPVGLTIFFRHCASCSAHDTLRVRSPCQPLLGALHARKPRLLVRGEAGWRVGTPGLQSGRGAEGWVVRGFSSM